MTKDMILPFDNFPGYALRIAANAAMSELTSVLAKFDLKLTEATVLILIEANAGCRQSQIGRALNIVSANMTPLISRLEDRKLVRREPVDGRSNGLYLTKLGAALTLKTARAMRAFEEKLASSIPSGERGNFIDTLKQIADDFS